MADEKYLEEYTLVFPTVILEKVGTFQGINFEIEKYLEIILDPKNHVFMKRREVETNPEYKQLIPYAVLYCGNDIFVYRRGKLMAEKRLQGNFSIGVGGHISISDPTLFGTTYVEGLKREINEEVIIETNYAQKVAALLNDDSNDVGKVHFGVVHTFKLEQPKVRPREKSVVETKFMQPEGLYKEISNFENWSKICIEHLDKLIRK